MVTLYLRLYFTIHDMTIITKVTIDNFPSVFRVESYSRDCRISEGHFIGKSKVKGHSIISLRKIKVNVECASAWVLQISMVIIIKRKKTFKNS